MAGDSRWHSEHQSNNNGNTYFKHHKNNPRPMSFGEFYCSDFGWRVFMRDEREHLHTCDHQEHNGTFSCTKNLQLYYKYMSTAVLFRQVCSFNYTFLFDC